MLQNCNYNKIKLLYDLDAIVKHVQRYAKKDARKSDHELCSAMYSELQKDLEKHIGKIKQAIVGLSKEDKFH